MYYAIIYAITNLTVRENDKVEKGYLAFNSVHRRVALLSLNEPLEVTLYQPSADTIYLATLTLEVDYLQKKKTNDEFKKDDLTNILKRDFVNQFFTMEQK